MLIGNWNSGRWLCSFIRLIKRESFNNYNDANILIEVTKTSNKEQITGLAEYLYWV